VILIDEIEIGEDGVARVEATGEGSTMAAEAVEVGMECLRREWIIDTPEIRRSRTAATVQRSLRWKGRLHQEIWARGLAAELD